MTEPILNKSKKNEPINRFLKQYSSWIILTLIVFFICIVLIYPMLKISLYNRPSVDDYSYSVLTHTVAKNGGNIFSIIQAAIKTSAEFYNYWQGLYTSAFILSLQPGIYGEAFYAIGSFFIILMIYLSPCVLFSTISHRLSNNRFLGIIIGLIIATLYMICVPNAVEGIYWFNGVANYTLFFCFTLLQATLLFTVFWDSKSKSFYIKSVLAIILGFLISGGNHVTALLQILLSFGFFACSAISRKKTPSIFLFIVFAISCFGLFLNLTSPGTAVRASAYITEKISPLHAISQAIQQTPGMIRAWFDIKVFFILLTLLPVIFNIVTTYKLDYKKAFSFRFPLLFMLFSYGSICALYCPTLLASNWLGPQRLNDVVYYYFLIMLVVNEFYLTGWVIFKIKKTITPLKINLINLVCFFVIFGLAIGIKFRETNNFEAYNELTNGSAAKYSEEADAREKLYLSSKNESINVCMFSVKPPLIFFSDGEEDPTIWPNTDIARYYELTSVTFNKCDN